MDTTSIIIVVAMFAMSAVFIGIGLHLGRKNSGAVRRSGNRRDEHTGYAGDTGSGSRDNNNANDSSSGDSSGGSSD